MFITKNQILKIKSKEQLLKDPLIKNLGNGSFCFNGMFLNKLMLNKKSIKSPASINLTTKTPPFFTEGWNWEYWMFDFDSENSILIETE